MLLLVVPTFAQVPDVHPGRGENLSLVTSFQREYAVFKANLTEEAERMPEADYNFRPSSDIRSYGELMGHVANNHFSACATLKGVRNPNQGINIERLKTKAEIVKAMKDSFAFCDPAFASLTQENLMDILNEREGKLTRAGAIAHLIAHSNEVYGTGAVYMRLKNLTPPLTERGMGSRPPQAVASCSASTASGTITGANAATGEMTVLTTTKQTLNLRADLNTVFNIPNAKPEDLHSSALAKSLPNANVQVEYCTRELWVRKVTVVR